MRLLAHVHMFPPEHNAGSETTLLAMLRGLVERGHEAIVIATESSKAEYDIHGVHVLRPPAMERNKGEWFLSLYRWCQIAITHLNCTGHAMHCAKETSKPLVHLVHNDKQLSFHHVKQSRVQLLIYNSEWLMKDYEGQHRMNPQLPVTPAIIEHPIVFPDQYRADREGAEAVTFVNLTVTKGALVFYKLAQRFPEIPFYGVRGAYGDEHMPPTDIPNLKIFNQMPDLRPVFAKTRVVLMPSDYESFGRVAVEAACSGIPAIVHPTPGLKESLGTAGIFCDRNNVDAWANELDRLYSDEAYYAERSKMALELAENLKPYEAVDRVEKALEIVLRHGIHNPEWTVEALGEELYCKKALEGGYFDPRREPRGYRPALSREFVAGPNFTSDRKIWLDSKGNPVDKSSSDKRILLMGAQATKTFDEALLMGVIDRNGTPFYSENFEGAVSKEEADLILDGREPPRPKSMAMPQVAF